MTSRITIPLLLLLIVLTNSCKNEISTHIESKSAAIDLIKVKALLQELDNQFSEIFSSGIQ